MYAPGSAGTTQEIFQEAAQNHYATYGYHSRWFSLAGSGTRSNLAFPFVETIGVAKALL